MKPIPFQSLNKPYNIIKISASIISLFFGLGCVIGPRITNYYANNPDLLNRRYSSQQISEIKKNFESEPAKYSQEFGDYVLVEMHRKSPGFALEFAQIPELNDGINPQEARAMMQIYNLLEKYKIPNDLFKENDLGEDVNKLLVEWTGNGSGKTEWSFKIGGNEYNRIDKVIDYKAIGFEQGEDKIDFKEGRLTGTSVTSHEDTDGVIFTIAWPKNELLELSFNGNPILFTPLEILLNQKVNNFDSSFYGKVTVKSPYQREPELMAIRDVVLEGKGDHRFSAPLQALLWGYMEGTFNEKSNPFENYKGCLEFVKPIWRAMDTERWDNYDEVTSRLNNPELLDYYINKKIVYSMMTGPTRPAYVVFTYKTGDCDDLANFGNVSLKKAGYSTFGRRVFTAGPDGHIGLAIKTDDGLYHLVVNFTPRGNSMSGPYKTILEVDKALGYGTRVYNRQSFTF